MYETRAVRKLDRGDVTYIFLRSTIRTANIYIYICIYCIMCTALVCWRWRSGGARSVVPSLLFASSGTEIIVGGGGEGIGLLVNSQSTVRPRIRVGVRMGFRVFTG